MFNAQPRIEPNSRYTVNKDSYVVYDLIEHGKTLRREDKETIYKVNMILISRRASLSWI